MTPTIISEPHGLIVYFNGKNDLEIKHAGIQVILGRHRSRDLTTLFHI